MESSSISPLNKAHLNAQLAKDFYNSREYLKSIECHLNAIKDFRYAATQTTDPKISKHLHSLADQHQRNINVIESKIKEDNERPHLNDHNNSSNSNKGKNKLLSNDHHFKDKVSSTSMRDSSSSTEPSFDDSYSYLRGQNSESSDPFNKFWSMIEGMISDISNPVAFATAPLDGRPIDDQAKDKDPQLSSSFELIKDSNLDSDNYKRSSLFETAANMFQNLKQYSFNFSSLNAESSLQSCTEDLQRASKVIEDLINENKQLKLKLQDYERRDKMHEALKGSIIKFGSEYKAQKKILASQELASSYSNNFIPNQFKQMEDELNNTKLELQKTTKQLKKHKDRWEMLKKSAGKRGGDQPKE